MNFNNLNLNNEFKRFNIIEPPEHKYYYIKKPYKLVLYKKKTQILEETC